MKTCPGVYGVSAACRFLLWDATGVGADVFLAAGLWGGKRVCWHPRCLAQPVGPAQPLLLMGFAKFVLKTVSSCEMQLFQVATAASRETQVKQSLRLRQI